MFERLLRILCYLFGGTLTVEEVPAKTGTCTHGYFVHWPSGKPMNNYVCRRCGKPSAELKFVNHGQHTDER